MNIARPAWATETIEPNPKTGANTWHCRTITVGEATLFVEQIVDEEGPCPAVALLKNDDAFMEWDAQGCRDFAAALLQAAAILEEASS